MDSQPLPEGQDLAELLSEARIISGDAGNGLGGSERDALADLADASEALLHRLETAERNYRECLDENDAFEAQVASLQAQLARAREALEPFADAFDLNSTDGPCLTEADVRGMHNAVDVQCFRRASEVFTSLREKGE